MKIDNSLLQAGALLCAGAIAVLAAVQARWDIVGAAMTGFFAVINIHPRDGGGGRSLQPPPSS